jgi:hypothetical protein
MSQFPHDEFAKEYLPELIKDYGEAKSGENVIAERREIDVFFQPTLTGRDDLAPTTPDTLGLLGRLAQTTALFEVFRNPVENHEITECLGKLFDVRSAIRREKRKSRTPSFLETEPFLRILTPTLAKQKLELFAAKRPANWEDGIYFLPAGLSAGIVVIHQLLVTEETLWLRILGKGKLKRIKEKN